MSQAYTYWYKQGIGLNGDCHTHRHRNTNISYVYGHTHQRKSIVTTRRFPATLGNVTSYATVAMHSMTNISDLPQ